MRQYHPSEQSFSRTKKMEPRLQRCIDVVITDSLFLSSHR